MMDETPLFQGRIANSVDYNNIARNALQKVHLYYDQAKIWYKWDAKAYRWVVIDEIDVLNAIDAELNISNITQQHVKSQLLTAFQMESRKRAPKELTSTQIQFKETIVDIKTGEQFPATPAYFACNPIPWKLGQSTDTPTIDRLLKEWVGEKEAYMLKQWLAFTIIPSYPLHRAILLLGNGSNGKTTYTKLLRRFVGDDNVFAGEFSTVFCMRFGTSFLYRKLGIILAETDYKIIERTAEFKSATGDDLIHIEFKNKPAFPYTNYAKVIIAANTLPRTDDKSEGFYRRFLLISFNNRFTEKYDILSQIPDEEYENLARACIDISQELLREGKFKHEQSIANKKMQYERISNPAFRFFEEQVELDTASEITRKELTTRLSNWLENNNLPPIGDREIRNLLPPQPYKDKFKEHERVWCGIRWKQPEGTP